MDYTFGHVIYGLWMCACLKLKSLFMHCSTATVNTVLLRSSHANFARRNKSDSLKKAAPSNPMLALRDLTYKWQNLAFKVFQEGKHLSHFCRFHASSFELSWVSFIIVIVNIAKWISVVWEIISFANIREFSERNNLS